MAAKNKPVHSIQDYPVRAAIWKQNSTNGGFYNTTLQRSYKDGDEYKSSDSFGKDDLLKLALVAQMAHVWIIKREEQDHQQTSGTE